MFKDKTDEYENRTAPVESTNCLEVKQLSLEETLEDQIRRTTEHLTRLIQVKNKLKYIAPETRAIIQELQSLGIYY